MPFMTQYTLCKVPIRTGLAFEICFNEIKMWLGGGGTMKTLFMARKQT